MAAKKFKSGSLYLLLLCLLMAVAVPAPQSASADTGLGAVAAGDEPGAVAVNPVTNKIYVANAGSNNVTVIDGATNATTLVPTGTNPIAIAVNSATNKIYVANRDSGSVTVIDGATNATTSVSAGTNPSAFAVNPVTNKIYVANAGSSNVTVIDGATNATTPVSVGASSGVIAVNTVTNKIYVANQIHEVVVINGVDDTVLKTFEPMGPLFIASAIAVNQATNTIYFANNSLGNLVVINGELDTLTTTVMVSGTPTLSAIATNEVTNKIYVTDHGYNFVIVVDGASNTLTDTIGVGNYPSAITLNPVTNKIYVANRDSGNVTVIDGASNVATQTVAAGDGPGAVAVNPVTNSVYVTNKDSDNVTVIDGPSNSTTTYAVTYDGNTSDGGTAPTETNKESGATFAAKMNTFTRTGYTFAGWNTQADGGGTAYAEGATVTMPSGALTLYAQWSAIPTYAVTYDGNNADGGTTPTETNQASGATFAAQTNTFTRTGYTFVGWNTQANGGGTSYAEGATVTMPSGALTLYAQWSAIPTFAVAYDGNDSDGGTSPTETNKAAGATFAAQTNTFARTGYTFTGWNTQADGGGTAYAEGATVTMPSGALTLYAQWSAIPTYAVTYDGNNADGGTTPTETNKAAGATFAAQANTFSRSGYTFAGWNTQAGGGGTSYAEGATVTMSAGALTLYAQWSAIPTFAVTYDGNDSDGGTAPAETNQVAGATFAAQANTFARTGYTFTGWNTQADGGGTSYAEGATVTMPPTYAVTYDGNESDGGTAPTETNQVTGATFAAKANTFARTGYTFMGWITQADGGGTAYAEGATVTMLAGALTLYAQWSAIPTYAIGPLSNVTMNTLTAGYASGAQDTKTVTVTRTGTGDLTGLAVALSGTNAGSYAFTQPAATTLNNGTPSTTFTVKPNDGLAAGTYTATITVSATGMTPRTFSVTQVVNLAGGGGGGSTSSPTPDTTPRSFIDKNGVPLYPESIDTTKPSVTLEVTPKDGVAYVNIPASILTSFVAKNATFFIEIQTPYGSYRVPVNLAFLIPELEDLLAANNLKAEDVSFKITLTDKSGAAVIQAALASQLPSGKVMGAIVDFSIEIMNIKTKQTIGAANEFSKAMVRMIPMPKEMTEMPELWGAFRYNEKKKQFVFVPARKVQIDGIWYAMISSSSNSVYVVAENAIGFADMRKHWGKSYVDRAAAKGLVEGVGEGRYAPRQAVTRAEFVAMLVRALGHGTSVGNTAIYDDVQPGAWYFGEVAAAKALGLLDFAGGSRFNPNTPLTREEMASMLAAAVHPEKLPITGEAVSLDKYKDIGSVDAAYLEDVRLMVKLRIMEGTSADAFSPKETTTRAEAAVVWIRTLQALGMID